MAGWKRGGLRAAAGAALGATAAVGAAAAEGAALNAIGFTALGPAAGSYAAGWMSSIAITNGIGVSAGSTYATLQAAAMGGGALTPVGIGVCAAVGAFAMIVGSYNKRHGGGDGDDDGDGDSKGDDDGDGDSKGDGDAAGGDAMLQ